MDEIANLALAALDTTLNSLLPGTVPPGLTRSVRVLPTHIRHLGMGGYIGQNAEPRGGIFGRHLDVHFEIDVSGGSDSTASSYLTQLTRGILTQDKTDLRRQGIFQLQMTQSDVRRATFGLQFEYLRLPITSEGVISDLSLNLDLNDTPYKTRYVWDVDTRALSGLSNSFAEFMVEDDPSLNAGSPASHWFYNNSEKCIAQDHATRGGPLSLTQTKKAGAQLLWRPRGFAQKLARAIAIVEFKSSSQDGIGIVFGRRDQNNFWYFLASERHRYHIFGRKEDGAYRYIGDPAAAGFTLNARHLLVVAFYDNKLQATIDGVRMLDLQTDSNVQAGEIGFLTHGNNGALFFRARFIELV